MLCCASERARHWPPKAHFDDGIQNCKQASQVIASLCPQDSTPAQQERLGKNSLAAPSSNMHYSQDGKVKPLAPSSPVLPALEYTHAGIRRPIFHRYA